MTEISSLWLGLEGFKMGDRIKLVVVWFGKALGWEMELSLLWLGLEDSI